MNSKRLEELKRQKALLEQHLDWLNCEIDREAMGAVASRSPSAHRLTDAIVHDRPVAVQFVSAPDPETASPEEVASDLYNQLGPDTRSAAADAKRGCLMIGSLAFGGLAAAIAAVLYFY